MRRLKTVVSAAALCGLNVAQRRMRAHDGPAPAHGPCPPREVAAQVRPNGFKGAVITKTYSTRWSTAAAPFYSVCTSGMPREIALWIMAVEVSCCSAPGSISASTWYAGPQ